MSLPPGNLRLTSHKRLGFTLGAHFSTPVMLWLSLLVSMVTGHTCKLVLKKVSWMKKVLPGRLPLFA